MAEHTVVYGSQVIRYTLSYRSRKTIAIEVHPDRTVHVKAPAGVELELIHLRVSKRGSWIRRQQERFASYAPPQAQRRYVSGEGYRYLGRQHRLKVLAGAIKVRLWRGYLEVSTPDPENREAIAKLVRGWYRTRAQQVFAERYETCRKHAASFGVDHEAGFDLLSMPKRWGSCTREGRILLNPALVSAPKDCIDYVITHELCHTRIHNHSAEYYELLSRIMPDWEERKTRLDQLVEAPIGI